MQGQNQPNDAAHRMISFSQHILKTDEIVIKRLSLYKALSNLIINVQQLHQILQQRSGSVVCSCQVFYIVGTALSFVVIQSPMLSVILSRGYIDTTAAMTSCSQRRPAIIISPPCQPIKRRAKLKWRETLTLGQGHTNRGMDDNRICQHNLRERSEKH